MPERDQYHQTYRRTLLDMHIPDWDPRFLSQYEPERLADLYSKAGVTGALYYCKSHMGLNYWPTPIGGIHPAAKHRDLVGELHSCLRQRSIAPAAYYSVVYDNWAVEHHPDWAIVPATNTRGIDYGMHGPRYGVACVNNPGYRDYEHAQIQELVRRYDFDALWIDMLFWPAICVCRFCRKRCLEETGDNVTDVLDWSSPRWCSFQRSRSRWLEDFYASILAIARTERPSLPVTHNFALGLGWFTAIRSDHSSNDTFTAGDFYGDRDQTLVVTKIMRNLTKHQPAEFMTSRTVNLGTHTSLKSEHQMLLQALAAIANGCAFLFIDAIDPVGTVNEDVYCRISRVFDEVQRYEPFLGGAPIEDVAVYFSDDSNIELHDNGRAIADLTVDMTRSSTTPHMSAVTGAARALQRRHIPFGIITRSQLNSLNRFRVVVLPDVCRMRADEVATFRAYVHAGGNLYASGHTSLVDSDGTARPDFALAEVFGCHLQRTEHGPGFYLRATSNLVQRAVAPERFLAHGLQRQTWRYPPTAVHRVVADPEGVPLAKLTLPYGYPSTGSRAGHDFASIHSSPPWDDLDNPTLVDHRFGRGRCIYSAAPIEAPDTETNATLITDLICDLLDHSPTIEAATHPAVWLTAFDQSQHDRIVLSAFRHETEPPSDAVPVNVRLRIQPGRTITGVRHAITGDSRPYSHNADRTVDLHLGEIELFDMFLLDYQETAR